MSNYHRLTQFRTFIASLKNAKSIKKLNETVSKKLQVACTRTRFSRNNPDLHHIKELNQVLAREFRNAAEQLSTSSNIKGIPQATLKKLQDSLYNLPANIDQKNEQYGVKATTSTHWSKVAEKLYSKLGKPAVLSAAGLSLVDDSVKAGTTEVIPEPPAIPDAAAEALKQLNDLGEPTFASLGLGGWTPVGLVQNCMEYVHVTMGVDWWMAIMIGTLIIRICLFPLVVLSQRNAARMNNILPQMQALQLKMTEARQTGDAIGSARYGQELMLFMKEKGVNPIKNMLVPLAQAPIFVSFFMGLREMANVPVDSLRHGGLFWFEDLTVPDQFFILPVITSLTLWLTIEIGTDSARISSQNGAIMKYVLRGLPLVILPFTVNFPGAILCYWVSSNFISLVQVAFLRIPRVREYFKIEKLQNFAPDQLPMKAKGFTEGIKDSWTNIKITKELEERRRLDAIQFRKAGKGPIQKTYKYDPTKQTDPTTAGSNAPISAKKR